MEVELEVGVEVEVELAVAVAVGVGVADGAGAGAGARPPDALLHPTTRTRAIEERRIRRLLSHPLEKRHAPWQVVSMPLTDQQRAEYDKLVQANKVVLFMKGSRHFPQCGFSATVIGILDKLTSGYDTVNILKEHGVRDGMKEYSSWPTFPQLYVGGEFVGGCDIVKEMYASGELQKLLGVEEKPVAPPKITLSASAAKAFTDAAADAGDDVLRLEIDAKYNCDLHFGPKGAGDIPVTANGVVLHVDRASASRADGVSIDFVEGPKGMGFKIENPNEPPRVKALAPKELKAMLDAGKVELFDVRPDDERALASRGRNPRTSLLHANPWTKR